MMEGCIKRDFLVSIRPTHVENIVGGRKTVELRRRFSEDVVPGAILLIYSTSPTRAIVGCATISGVVRLPLAELWAHHGAAACVDRATFDAYFCGLDEGYAILLQDVKPFAKQVPAAALKERFGFTPPQSFMYLRREYYPLLSDERIQATH